jgi:hypothetical protein
MLRLACALGLLIPLAGLEACALLMDDSYSVSDEHVDIPDAALPLDAAALGEETQSTCGISGAMASTCPPGCECPDATTCLLRCKGKDGCKEKSIGCPPGMNCEVRCEGDDTCAKARVDCTGSAACNVVCGESGACKDLKVVCAEGPCSVQCPAGCDHATVECGTNACTTTCGAGPKPNVKCGPSCSCSPC